MISYRKYSGECWNEVWPKKQAAVRVCEYKVPGAEWRYVRTVCTAVPVLVVSLLLCTIIIAAVVRVCAVGVLCQGYLYYILLRTRIWTQLLSGPDPFATAIRAWPILYFLIFPYPLFRNGASPNEPTMSPGYGHFPTIMAQITVPFVLF